MAEVKSTLDLVLERTRNLTLSEDEKKGQATDNAKKIFNGAVQKYLDSNLDMAGLEQALVGLQKQYPEVERQALREALLEKIDLAALHGPLPDLLEHVFGCRVAGLKNLDLAYARDIQALAQERSRRLRDELKDRFQISGSAVVPNLAADAQWIEKMQALRSSYHRKLIQEKAALN